MTIGSQVTAAGCALALGVSISAGAQAPGGQIRADIVGWVAQQRPPLALTRLARSNEVLWSLTRRFYAQRDFQAAWHGDGGDAGVRDLLGRLDRAEEQGLDSADYSVALIRALATQEGNVDSLALLDLVATVAFLRYASDLSLGRVAPAAVDTMWAAADRPVDLVARLVFALDSGRVDSTLGELAPPQREAVRLRAALALYRDIAAQGGWVEVTGSEPLAWGAAGPRVQLLRRRLEVTGDLAPGGSSEVFDSALEAGVRRAQARHGLHADGIAGRLTLAALNVPVAARIRQLELNLERWRWAPRDLAGRYISVNSAGFSLDAVDSGRTALTSAIVAGRVDWPTPIVSGLLTEVTFNPRWTIPPSIAVQEILPEVRRDRGFLYREGIHVSDTAELAVELDRALIPWDSIADSAFACRLWQEPGPRNPLGHVRFGIRNRFGVALHDTPYPQGFSALARALSHGCVRVEAAELLASFVLGGLADWSADSVRAAVAQGSERFVTIPDPIPVVLGYWTAWVGSDGTVEFRPDVYGWDAELARALKRAARSGRR
jgi:murein L,D-transpeptidase YcbB/YkuD